MVMYDFSCIDFETANNNMNSACSVGIVAVSNLQIVKKDYFLIKPVSPHFRRENIEIHGITPEMVEKCDQFPGVWKKLGTYFEHSDYIIAHNARFDMSVLHETALAYGITIPDFTYMDSISLSGKMRTGCGNSLAECAKYFNVPLENHHNSLSDAETCANIVISAISSSRYKDFNKYINAFSSIKKRKYSDLSVKKSMSTGHFEKIAFSELAATTSEFNINHPLFGKNCVLTGELESLSRKDALQKILDIGGNVKSSVSSKTDYLIVGTQDKKLVGEDGLSSKEEKAYEFIRKGKSIKIINEEEFLKLLSNN